MKEREEEKEEEKDERHEMRSMWPTDTNERTKNQQENT